MMLTLKAPAKLNLSLDIIGKTSDNYHQLDSVMVAVDLYDELTFERGGEGAYFSCDRPDLPMDDDNLVVKATNLFFSVTGISTQSPGNGIKLRLQKVIPRQAGLGGGSSDAAATLSGLNRLYQTGLSREELVKLSVNIGSDIPFCINGGIARAGGRGEIIESIAPLPSSAVFVIAKPEVGVSTHKAFYLYSQNPVADHFETGKLVAAINSGNMVQIGGHISNIFEGVLDISQVHEIKKTLLGHGALGAAMTGSGSAVSGLFESVQTAEICLEDLRKKQDIVNFSCICSPLYSS